jgi:membrane protein implicated in regulation of membrane protease activity
MVGTQRCTKDKVPHKEAPYEPLRTIVKSSHSKRPGCYEVLYEGTPWCARPMADEVFRPGDEVEVSDRNGNVLVIRYRNHK